MKLKGIDVSSHQDKINWDQVKADGIKFAMIRMGFGGDNKSQDDKQFERNVRECERVGIPWGAYLYSYALNMNNAKSEVAHAKRLLKGKKPQFPISFDMEDADNYKKRNGMPTNSMLINICDYWLNEMEKSGYYVSLYANLYWLNTKLKHSKLNRYDKWLAQWTSKPTYSGSYQMWQYTDKGRVKGIKGNVDMNIAYTDFKFNKPKPTPKPDPKPTDNKKDIIMNIGDFEVKIGLEIKEKR